MGEQFVDIFTSVCELRLLFKPLKSLGRRERSLFAKTFKSLLQQNRPIGDNRSLCEDFDHTDIHGTHVPVEEPTTAPIADIPRRKRYVRSAPESRHWPTRLAGKLTTLPRASHSDNVINFKPSLL
jgi:hypothetical protein